MRCERPARVTVQKTGGARSHPSRIWTADGQPCVAIVVHHLWRVSVGTRVVTTQTRPHTIVRMFTATHPHLVCTPWRRDGALVTRLVIVRIAWLHGARVWCDATIPRPRNGWFASPLLVQHAHRWRAMEVQTEARNGSARCLRWCAFSRRHAGLCARTVFGEDASMSCVNYTPLHNNDGTQQQQLQHHFIPTFF